MIRLNIKAGNNIVQVEGDSYKDVFKQASVAQEIFGEKCCGKCQSPNIKFVVRTDSEDNEYYEMHCTECYSKLAFGQNKENKALFPIRSLREGKNYKLDANGKKIPKGSNGWVKFNRSTGQEE